MEHARDEQEAKGVADRMAELYVTARDRFVVMRPEGIYIPRCKGRTMRLTDNSLIRHVRQEYAISVYAAELGNKFFCLDVDDGGEAMARSVIGALERFGIPSQYVHASVSGGKGYHVEMFFSVLVEAKLLERLYRWVLNETGASERQIECRPTHKQAIKLPLSRHHKTGAVCWFLDKRTFAPIESMEYVFGIEQMDASLFQRLVEEKTPNHNPNHDRRTTLYTGRMAEGIAQDTVFSPLREVGTRHAAMLDIAVNIRSRGLDAAYCEDALYTWIAEQDQGMFEASDAHVQLDIRKIVRWAYHENFKAASWQWDSFAVTGDDMLRLFRRRGLLERKLYFLLMALERSNRKLRQQDIADVLKSSHQGVVLNLEKLKRNGDIAVFSIAKRTKQGFICRQANKYFVIPHDVAEAERKALPAKHQIVECPANAITKQLEPLYFQTIFTMFGSQGMRKRMADKEYEAFQAAVSLMKSGLMPIQTTPLNGD